MTQPAQYISGRTVQEQMDQLIGYVDTRAAEVATDAIASDVAQVHQDMLDADADASAAAASAAAAAGTLANAVKKTGEASQSIAGDVAVAGDLSAGGDASVTGDAGVQGQLSVLGGCDLRAPVKIPVTPTNNDDAASKKYVDDSLAGYVPMVRTTGNQTIAGEKKLTSPIVGSLKPYKTFGSNTNSGWYAICKFPKSTARQSKFTVTAPGNYNIILTETSTSIHNINTIKFVGSYTPNRNAFLLAEVSDGYILYVWSASYRTNILHVDYVASYGTLVDYTSVLDDSVFTGTPELTKPAVGGDIVAIYDEAYLTQVTS